MSDPIREYQEALRTYAAARTEGRALITYISDTAGAMQTYLSFFLFQSYSLPPIGDSVTRPQGGKRLPNISEWPDAEKLQTTLKAWHEALARLHQAWNNLPANDRTGFDEPPKSLASY